MSDTRDDDEPLSVIHGIHDPVIADADPKVITARQFCSPSGSWIVGQTVDRRCDATRDGPTQSAVVLDRFGVEADVVAFVRR